MPKKSGFTLVELLVVITIIGILSAIGMASFSNVQNKAKDAKRRADVDSVVKAFEGKYDETTFSYVEIEGSDFNSGNPPFPPEGGNYKADVCKQSNEIKAYQICTKLGEFTGTCPATGADEKKCYCRSSAFGEIKECEDSDGTTTTLTIGEVAGGGGGGGGGNYVPPGGRAISKALSCENYGDLSNDKKVGNDDADMISKYEAGLITLTEEQKFIGNVDLVKPQDDKTVDGSDALHIKNYVNGRISQLNACQLAKNPPCPNGIGDATTDGKVTYLDSVEAIRLVSPAGRNSIYTGTSYTGSQSKRADVSGDGQVTSLDGLCITRYVNGDVTTSPCSYMIDCAKQPRSL